MSRRKLTEDEIDLWKKVVKQTERLQPEKTQAAQIKPLPKPKPQKAVHFRTEPFEIGSKAAAGHKKHDLKPAISSMLNGRSVKMDEKSYRRMKRGKLRPEGKLDLHGMRIDTAHPALTRFILSSQTSGKRLVLVITGKGKDRDEPGPMPVPRGILRHKVPQWLSLPPLSQAVLQVTQAHISHGGEGAYYIYLRRSR